MSPEVSIPRPTSAKDIAQKVLGALSKRRKLEDEKKHALPKGTAWALSCAGGVGPNGMHVGLIFCEGVDPIRETRIHGGMWFTSYHDPTEGFYGNRGQVVCDQCLRENGERVPLRVTTVEGDGDLGLCFSVPHYWKRFLHRINVQEILGTFEPEEERAVAKPKAEK